MVACNLRMVVVTIVVITCRRIAILGLEIRYRELRVVAPITGRERHRLGEYEILQGIMRTPPVGHVQVTGQRMVKSRYVCRPLDRGVSAQCKNTAARPADIAQQGLQHPGTPDNLHSDSMLCPADRVSYVGCLVAPRIIEQGLCDLEKTVLGTSAYARDHIRSVTGIMFLYDLKNALRVFKRRVRLGTAGNPLEEQIAECLGFLNGRRRRTVSLIRPACVIIIFAALRKTGENAVKVLRILESRVYQNSGIGIVANIFLEKRIAVPSLAVNYIVDQRSEENYIGAGAYLHMNVAERRGAREARVNMDQLGPMFGLRPERPAKCDRVALSHIRAHDHYRVGVNQIAGKGR